MITDTYLIKDEVDWQAHKDRMDRTWNSKTFYHDGDPEQYPCLAMSEYWDDPNGPHTFIHTFTYYDDCARLVKLVLEQQTEKHLTSDSDD